MTDADRVSVLQRIIDSGGTEQAALTEWQQADDALLLALESWRHQPMNTAQLCVAIAREVRGPEPSRAELRAERRAEADAARVARWQARERAEKRATALLLAIVAVVFLVVTAVVVVVTTHNAARFERRCHDHGGQVVHVRGDDLCLAPGAVVPT